MAEATVTHNGVSHTEDGEHKGKEVVAAPVAEQGGYLNKLATNFCYALEVAVHKASGAAKTGKLNPYLNGNFAPVSDELFETNLEVVEGKIPSAVNGAFMRTGPNPFMPPVGQYHWFDGDGMVHAVRLKDGKATYCNRFVETSKLEEERKAGYPAYPKFGDFKGKWGLVHIMLASLKQKLGVISPAQSGRGTGNTALVYHAQRLLTLHEGDLPYALRLACEGLLETLGRVTFDGGVGHSFTAHPKVDPKTGELFFFGYAVDRKPYCWYSLADKDGNLVHDYPVPLPDPIMMHDFAITENYAIFIDVPLVFKPEAMVKEGKMPFKFDKTRAARWGVLPRYAKDASQIKWFETEGMMVFHVANAWEEGNLVKLFVCAFKEFDLDGFTASCDEDSLPHVTEICMDMAGGGVTVRRVADVAGDFPVVPQNLIGRKTRYTYMGAMGQNAKGLPEFYGIAKIDLQEKDPAKAVAGLIKYNSRCLGGEAFFAPSGGKAEDDGHLLTFVHNEDTMVTELQVFDAKSMSSKPVARVKMPRRVPYGFHCLWINEEQLQEQAKAQAGFKASAAPIAVAGKAKTGGLMPLGGLGKLFGGRCGANAKAD